MGGWHGRHMKDNCAAVLFGFKKNQAFCSAEAFGLCIVWFLIFKTWGDCLTFFLTFLEKMPQAKWRYLKVLSIFHMSMVIFHMSGVIFPYVRG